MDAEPKPPDFQFKGKFLFVNSEGANLSTAKQRHAINGHVQSQYHRWRKQESARKLRESPVVPVKASSSNGLSGSSPGSDEANATALKKPRASRTSLDSVSTCLNFTTREIPSPAMNMVADGNSDPFSCIAIPLTPKIGQLVSFSSTWVLPGFFSPDKPDIDAYANGTAFDMNHLAFQDACHAFAHMAVIAVNMAATANDSSLIQESVKLKNNSLQILKSRIQQGVHKPDVHVLHALRSLFCVELASRNLTAAAFHVSMLFHLSEQAKATVPSVARIREQAAYIDMHFASIFLTRPFINIPEWFPGLLDMDWHDLLSAPSPNITGSPWTIPALLHPLLTSEPIRQVFLDIREVLYMDDLLTRHSHLASSAIFRWMHLRKHDCEARLIHLYLDLTSPGPGPANLRALETNLTLAAACVAALSWTGLTFGNRPKINGGMRFPDQLRAALSNCDSALFENVIDPDLKLWILYVGAITEEMASSPRMGQLAGEALWYTRTLGEHVRKIKGRLEWVDVMATLERFLFTPTVIGDHVGWWYRKVLGVWKQEYRPRLPKIATE